MASLKIPELLAPAGSPEALRAAVAAGADAVYLSGKRFGARKYAINFDEAELKDAIDYAHLRGVRVYVTVNILIKDKELQDVAQYLLYLYEIGTDAILIQDIGIAALARKIVPEMDLHASTQLTIHNREGVAWAMRKGFKRVVLARELPLQEIKSMKTPGLGLEIFVHGALCYCYSGQCLLSSVIGGRSGNRGMCAQPCRKPYVLLRGEEDEYGRPINLLASSLKEKFLISTRDLATYRNLDKIVHLPVESIKIEGRMKSPEYVAIVTYIYRKALNEIALGTWDPSDEDLRDLAIAFNRGFTDGYIMRAKNVMGRQMSNNRGIFIGTVSSYDSRKNETVVRLKGALAPKQGDGLAFVATGQEFGMMVFKKPLVKDTLLKLETPKMIRSGTKVYLTSSHRLSKKAQMIISNKAQIPIDLKVYWIDKTPVIEGRLEKGVRIKVNGPKMETAINNPLTEQQIENQLRKTGETPFLVKKVEMRYPGNLFLPIKALNQFRRNFISKATESLLELRRPTKERIFAARRKLNQINLATSIPTGKQDLSLAAYADNLETVRGAIEGGCERVYLEPFLGHECRDRTQMTLNLLQDSRAISDDAEIIWKWPRITREGYLKFAEPLLSKTEVDGIMVENVGAAEAVLSTKPDALLYGGMGLNIWNHLTVYELSPPFRLLTLSPELSKDQLVELAARSHMSTAKMSTAKLEILVQGNQEVMISEDCISSLGQAEDKFLGLHDFRRVFPVRLDDEYRTHIFNSVETSLLDYIPKIFEIGLDGVAIDARGRTERYAKEMTEIYGEAIRLTMRGEKYFKKEFYDLKEKIRSMALGGITSGPFVKELDE